MSELIRTAWHRITAEKLPPMEEIEQFGAVGEERVYRVLCEHFDCVLRNVVVPHRKLYLEKDFMVIERGIGFIIEVKNWKGVIGASGDSFYQNKENGEHKTLKSPVGTTQQFMRRMCDFYKTEAPLFGMVVFCEPDCELDLPESIDGIALLKMSEMVRYIRRTAAQMKGHVDAALDPSRILRCTRFYSTDSEFCKGMLADCFFDCENEAGEILRVSTTALRYLSVTPQPLRMRDKLHITYVNGATDTFYNRDITLTVGCLDGSWRKIALHRVRHIAF